MLWIIRPWFQKSKPFSKSEVNLQWELGSNVRMLWVVPSIHLWIILILLYSWAILQHTYFCSFFSLPPKSTICFSSVLRTPPKFLPDYFSDLTSSYSPPLLTLLQPLWNPFITLNRQSLSLPQGLIPAVSVWSWLSLTCFHPYPQFFTWLILPVLQLSTYMTLSLRIFSWAPSGQYIDFPHCGLAYLLALFMDYNL